MEKVLTAINYVMNELGSVQKSGQMKMGNKVKYSYFSEDDLLNAVRPLFQKHELVIFPSGVSDAQSTTYVTSGGSTMNHFMATYHFTIAHTKSGQSIEVVVRGEGADTGDKGANKAATGAMKYALRQTFMVATGDDPDAVSSDAQERATQQQTQKQTSGSKKQETKKQSSEEVVNPEWLEKALSYEIPDGTMFAGQQLRSLLKDETMGPMIMEYLCGHDPDGDGKMFEPVTDEDKSLQNAALYIHKFHEDYKKLLEKYKATVN